MSEPIEDYEHDGVPVKIYHDDDPRSPREDDQLAVLYCWHPRYTLGDEQFDQSDHDSMADVVEYLRSERKAVVIVPLFLLDHSGITMRAGSALDLEAWTAADIEARDRFVGDAAGWDTTHVGFAYVTIERADELGAPHDSLERQLRNEVKEYDQFLTGDVYGYVVGEDTPFEESCWGFFGLDYTMEEANSIASHVAKSIERERDEAAHWAARDTVTV